MFLTEIAQAFETCNGAGSTYDTISSHNILQKRLLLQLTLQYYL